MVSSTVRVFVSAKLMMTFNPDCKVSRVELVRRDYGMSDPDLVGLSTNSPSVAVLPFYLLSWADSIHSTSHQLPNLREKYPILLQHHQVNQARLLSANVKEKKLVGNFTRIPEIHEAAA